MSSTDSFVEEEPKMEKIDTRPFLQRRHDVVAWCLGVLFIIAVVGGMFGFGALRGWDANSGWTHNESLTSEERFLPEPFEPEPGVPGRYGDDAAARWYYWKLPPNQVTEWSRTAVWLCYSCHQMLMWGCIFYGQKQKLVWQSNTAPRYSGKLETFNYVALIINAVFHLLHLGQTHWTYDATAQDVSVASSQSSVIMLIVLVLVLEYRDRGLAFGWPTVRNTDRVSRFLLLPKGTVNLLRKYHGYAFAWAAIYTFWYHPMENTWGHAMGFAHTFMIMLQGSLIYTKMHLNRYWRLALESWVILHASVVASQTGGPDLNGTLLWPMFCFGFLWLFTMTQVYGLPFWKKLPSWVRPTPFVIYLAATIGVYSTLPDRQGRYWIRLNEIIRIPGIEYLAVLFSWVLIEFLLFIERKAQANTRPEPLSPAWEALYLMFILLIYVLMITLSSLVQILDLQMSLILLMVILVFVFIVGVSVSSMLLKQCFRRPAGKPAVAPAKGQNDVGETKYGTNEKESGIENVGLEQ
ncbi:uncharacterized protein LOC119720195 [Patiria miniata]|uniref:Uncharacterized protein n=1 Tax=Patiria miniata TaxID=46514 RepID=A0A913Z1D5_PATMI|nr:uncharacterized protein LOC119720195 [Patiria miniata]XP_038045704.1 uncharacterized protein LOC119720195 [Patiria miniata]XP_038045705.1 uncharacterized protein LOC119720195 [Patiria miniata]XP_038045706.1 uncharacterized protein LOC119720195 [Patiria miniata]